MLDTKTFGKWLSLMSELYSKPVSEALGVFLYEEWSVLTDIQFERGARLVMRKDQRFPTIDRLIELARSPAEARRSEQGQGTYQPDPLYQTDKYDPMSPEAQAARSKVREQLAELRRGSRESTTFEGSLTSLSDLLGSNHEVGYG
ncbi:MAG: hypothetical protein F6K42_12585 [Leptolyngbya sp. SIO1D8]|nr:hypothetical protein [Leptolyngbya sp. SIO1D8]